MHITFVATRKNMDPSERELYEMDFLLRTLNLKRSFADLGLLTVAACTPEDVEVAYVDEYLEEVDYDLRTDLVALSAKTSCVTRAYAVAAGFRERGTPVVLGGIHASLRPDEALEHVDCIVTGEAETVWPQVVADARAGRLQRRYDASEFPPMAEVPDPAWHLVDTTKVLFQQLQTTRGCPFTCRFCSVPDISGQSFRFKPVQNVLRELVGFPKRKPLLAPKRPLYVVDDNFLSRKTYTLELLRAMAPAYARGDFPHWSAETTLNVASDEELLDAFVEAGCQTLIIGFESVSEDTLKDMAKPINFCLTFQEAVERIHRRGISVVGNFIVGFDTDTIRVFRDTLDFVQATGILYPFFSILNPMPGTKLFDDFKAAGRMDHEDWQLYDTRHVVMEPAQMTRDELLDGYIWLYEQAYGSELMWERLERYWRTQRELGLPAARRVAGPALKALMARDLLRDRELRRFAGPGFELLKRRELAGEPGQLLVLLDSYDFARFMRRYRSADWTANVRTFQTGGDAVRMQWKNAQAQRRTAAS